MAARIALVSVLSLVGLAAAVAQQPAPLLGYPPAASEAQRALEADFRADLDAEDQAEWARQLSARPHHVGSPYGAENARYLAGLFESWGYEVETETYQILMPFPDVRVVEMTAPEPFRATLEEDVVAGDASTAQRDEVLAPYNAFSADGEAEGELVFVNYGVPEDYEVLERYGIDVTGKIAIARYGRSWRGIKPKLAAEHGAIGALIYSDPIDDGYAQGDVYPDGPFKNASGVQRGSVMDMPVHTGDVLTPGRPAIPGVPRLAREEAPTITKIPVLPISYRDAQPLLAALGGEVVPPPWRGALPITYHFGPGPARVRLEVRADWQQVDAMNVIARWPGARYPDEWILRGNHHDAWNHGARDPISGLVTLLSEAKAVAALARAGHPPQRTLVYAAWDAEEEGLIGSTEWVEDHAEELDEHAVAYINTDGYGRGFLDMGGSHVLEAFFSEVAGSVEDPQTRVSLADRLRATLRVNGNERQRSDAERANLRLDALGSGSDYTPFLQHLGIASANLSFGGESANGSYHTLYDTYDHFTEFVDPGFRYGVALAEVTGLATLRLANAPLLPVRFGGLADSLNQYVEELETLADSARQAAERRAALLDRGDFDLVLDPERTFGPPPPLPKVPHFNFAPLENAVEALSERAKDVDARLARAGGSDASLEEVNALLYRSERLLTSQEGLPGRPWYRHQVYAPGFYTGYGVKTLPRVREAIEARLYDEVDAEIAATAATLAAFADHLALIGTALDGRDALPLANLGLEHLDVVVPDPAASARFYTRIFGSPLHQQPVRDTLRYFVLLGDLPSDRQVGYIAIGAANGRTPAIGHYCVLAKVYDRTGMASTLEAAGFSVAAAGPTGMWPDPDGLDLQLFQPPAGLVTAAVPSPLPGERDGILRPRGLDHVLLRVGSLEQSLPYYRLVYGQAAERPRDANGRVWFELDRGTRIGLEEAASGQEPAIAHYAIAVAPFDRAALTARLGELGSAVLDAPDEPGVVRFTDDNGIVVEVRESP